MARSFARCYVRIWADPEWRALDVDSQHLYLLLISQPSMNMAGVLPLQLRKWASCSGGQDIAATAKALDRLREDRFVLVDEDTEEVLVRSLIRNDEAYKTPGMLKSILRFAEGTQAAELRRTLAIELGRLDPLEGKKAEEGTALIAATRLILMPEGTPPDGGVIHRSDGIADTIPEPMPDGIGDGIRGAKNNPSGNPSPNPSVSVSVSVPSLSLVGTSVGRGEEPPPPEPPQCKKHAHLASEDVPPCPFCQRLRVKWEQAREEAAKPAAWPPWCGECSEFTRLVEIDDATVARCSTCHPRRAAS